MGSSKPNFNELVRKWVLMIQRKVSLKQKRVRL